MKLSEKAIEAIKDSPECRRELTYQMEVSDNTLYRWYRDNESDGKLTTYKAINIIKETTGLTEEQILETEKTPA